MDGSGKKKTPASSSPSGTLSRRNRHVRSFLASRDEFLKARCAPNVSTPRRQARPWALEQSRNCLRGGFGGRSGRRPRERPPDQLGVRGSAQEPGASARERARAGSKRARTDRVSGEQNGRSPRGIHV